MYFERVCHALADADIFIITFLLESKRSNESSGWKSQTNTSNYTVCLEGTAANASAKLSNNNPLGVSKVSPSVSCEVPYRQHGI